MGKTSRRYVMTIDQGTSGTLASLYTLDGQPIASADVEVRSYFPHPGWVEQDPYELLASVRQASGALAQAQGLQPTEIEALGLSNQGEAFVAWDIETGEPIYPSINWQCVRSAEFCQNLIDQGWESEFQSRTGLPIHPEWPATKIPWLLENVPAARSTLKAKRLAFGTLDAWMIYNFSPDRRFVTEPATASRSGLYNIHQQGWDPALIKTFQAEGLLLPEILPSTADYGDLDVGLGWLVPLRGSCLDQSAALLGQACVRLGDTKITYGTTTALWINHGLHPAQTKKVETSLAWQVNDSPTYAVVGEPSDGGSILFWLRDRFRLPWRVEELSSVAERATGQEDFVFVPALTGLGTPHWVPEARGTIYGLTAGAGLEHLVRASLESVAFGVRDFVEALGREEELELPETLKVDGGMVANDYLMQFQADILGKRLVVPKNLEGTSRGVAILAAIGSGQLSDVQSARDTWRARRSFEPRMPAAERDRLYEKWRTAVAHTIGRYRPQVED